MLTDDTINYDSIYETTKNLRDFDLDKLMNLIDNSDLNKILNTKEIIFGGELKTDSNDMIIQSGLRGNIGLITYYKTFFNKTLANLKRVKI